MQYFYVSEYGNYDLSGNSINEEGGLKSAEDVVITMVNKNIYDPASHL